MAHHQPIRKTPASRGKEAGGGSADIPDKLYFRIGEVARLCAVPAYVLRFWESEFPQLKPNKGGTGQRLFRRRDVEMALHIKQLLYDEGYTIPGARQLLKGESRAKEPQLTLLGEDEPRGRQAQLRLLRQDLQNLLTTLQEAPGTMADGKSAGRQDRSAGRPTRSHAMLKRPSLVVASSEQLFDFSGWPAAQVDATTDQNEGLKTRDEQ